jgi:hypothetical protein
MKDFVDLCRINTKEKGLLIHPSMGAGLIEQVVYYRSHLFVCLAFDFMPWAYDIQI